MHNNKRSSTSIAAFLFMPQFHLCFRGFSHIVPIFMRTLALMFAQAGLIPYNHPATRYGIEGVRKYSFSELMGEAWFTLRHQKASLRQWGLFTSVILMIAVFLSAIGAFFLNILVGGVAVAQAQIFSHPTSPYGSGNNTDTNALSAISPSPAPMFDSRTAYDTGTPDSARASLDLGLMILDKALRQSTVGNGGAMQAGLAGMMQVYNTGILVVAAVMIFWMILSIVVDTAKSGTIGGGRHNMVWTPIRVVFALGLMIPLGTTGFSSGQFAVMKLAEWGSNFGTRIWVGYVDGVINGSSLLTPFMADSASAMAVGLTRIKVCQVAWNTELAKQSGLVSAFVVQSQAPRTDKKTGLVTVRYTNTTAANLCGTIEYSAIDTTVGESWGDQMAGGASLQTLAGAAESFRAKMRSVLADDLRDSNGQGGNGFLIEKAREFACGYVGLYTRPNSGGGVVQASGLCSADLGCGSTESSPPDLRCHKDMIEHARRKVEERYNEAKGDLETYITGPMIEDMKSKGWAGMGGWSYYISVLNGLGAGARDIGVSIAPGTMWAAPSEEKVSRGFWSSLWGSADIPLIEQEVRTVNAAYTNWWTDQIAKDDAQSPDAAARNDSVYTSGVDRDKFRSMTEDSSDGGGLSKNIISVVMPSDANFVDWFSIKADDNVYPFARLVSIGQNIMNGFMGALAALTLLQIGMSFTFMGTGAPGFVSSALATGLTSLCSMGVLAGMVLAFYVPILPLIRTTFAALTWIISVFEAVAMVPIAALAHLNSEGEGLAGAARTVWILWLNVLLRPAMVVVGFVAAMLIFNTFAVYFHINFSHGVHAVRMDMNPFTKLLSYIAYTVIYVGALYTAANSTFKLLDLIPDAMMRWMGGTPDKSFDDNSTEGMIYAAGRVATSFQGTWKDKKPKPDPKPPKDLQPT